MSVIKLFPLGRHTLHLGTVSRELDKSRKTPQPTTKNKNQEIISFFIVLIKL